MFPVAIIYLKYGVVCSLTIAFIVPLYENRLSLFVSFVDNIFVVCILFCAQKTIAHVDSQTLVFLDLLC